MKCEECIRRPRHAGGNGSCPLFYRRERQVFAAAGSMKMRTERASAEESWAPHLAANPRGCTQFKPGDARTVLGAPADQEMLF